VYCHQQEDKHNCPVLSAVHGDSGLDRMDMCGTIVLSVMVDADKSSTKTDEKQKKAREKMIVVLLMEGTNKGFKLLLETWKIIMFWGQTSIL
jgi:hypothetical protein